VFASTEKKEDGTEKEIVLLKESDTPTQRHVKIKADANPYDPQWEPYFELRWGKTMLNSSRGRRKLYHIWQGQEVLCPICQMPITKDTLWGTRRIVKKSEGGSEPAIFRSTISIAVTRSSAPNVV
jgi:RNA-directed DNA polymerase